MLFLSRGRSHDKGLQEVSGKSAEFKQAGGGPRGHSPHPECGRPKPGQPVKENASELPGVVSEEDTGVPSPHGDASPKLSRATPQHRDMGTSNEEDEVIEETPVKKPLEDPGATSSVPPVTVCMLKSVSKFTVPVQVDGVAVEAVLDSTAEVTIISDKIYESLTTPPKKLYDVRLDTVDRQLSMKDFVAGPVKLKIGRSTYDGPVYVAPIEQDMLFGVNITRKGSAVTNMGRGMFSFTGHEIRMNSAGLADDNPQVARVSVAKRVVIPPDSAAQVPCKMDQLLSDYVIELLARTEKIYGPRVVRTAGTDPVVCIVNCSNRYRLLRKGKEVATDSPVQEFLPEEEEDDVIAAEADICEVSKAEDELGTDV